MNTNRTTSREAIATDSCDKNDSRTMTTVETPTPLRRPNSNGDEKIPTGPPPNMGAAKKRLGRTLSQCKCILLALFCGLSLTGCNHQAPAPAAPQEVATVTVVGQSVLLTTELPGRTSPYRVAEIRPQVSGHILKRLFTEGSDVQAGEELYQIDPAPFQAALDTAEANLPSLRSRAARYKQAVVDRSVSQQDFDDADGALKQVEAEIETARINLGYTRVDSPIPGRIGRSSVTDGAIVTSYQPMALATVQQLDPIYVDVPQSTTELLRLERRLKDGSVNHGGTNANQVQLILEDGSQYPLEGTLQFREVTVDPTTGSVMLRMVFPNPNKVLLPDMFVRAVVKEGVKVNAILVPQQAVVRDPKGNPFVWVVGKDGKVEHRLLNLDRAIGDQWLVSSGLEPNEHIVVEGLQRVRPGAVVTEVPFDGGKKTSEQPTQTASTSK
jgi:membrane fusion protein (multidrug efflux system)